MILIHYNKVFLQNFEIYLFSVCLKHENNSYFSSIYSTKINININ